MQTTSTSRALKKTAALLLPVLALTTMPLSAALYWDINGVTEGAGATPTGTWNAANTNWNTDSTGLLAPGVWAASETAIFSAGSDATDTFTVTLSAAQTASAVIVEEGTVTLAGSALNIGAGSITINSGAKLSIPATANITATAGATMNLNGGTMRNTVNLTGGPAFISSFFTINVGAAGGTVETATTGTFTTIFTGNIKGVGNTLTKTGVGEFRYQGANTAGATFAKLVVNQGLFRLGNVSGNNFETGFGAVPAVFTPDAITLDTGSIGTSWLAADSILHPNRGITLAAGGGTIMSALTVPGAVTGPGGLSATAGGVNLNGLNTFTGGITVTTGTTTIGAAGGMLAQSVNNNGTLLVNGIISGASALTKTGTGTLTLNGDNTYTGSTVINTGILNVGHANALGTPGANTQIASGAELRIDGATKTFTLNEPLQIAGPGAGGGGAITIQNLSNPTISGPVTLTGDATVTVSSTATGTFSNVNSFTAPGSTLTLQGGSGAGGGGRISGAVALGAGGLTKLQGGRWILSGANTYTGVTAINAGTLQFAQQVSLYNNVSASWTDTNISVASGATLALNVGGSGEFTAANIDAISALGTATGGFASGSTLALDTTNSVGENFTYSGVIANPNGGANALGLAKNGTGTLTLTAANTYTGTTTVSAGTLAESATGSIADTSNLTVSGATSVFSLGADHSDTVGTVTLAGGGSITGTGTSALTSTGTFAMQNGTVSAILAGIGIPLNKTTTGTVTLAGANTYTGDTIISAGTLLVTGSLNGTAKVDISGTLGGIGSITPTTDGNINLLTGGKISPGTSVGNLTLSPSGTGVVNLAGATDTANSQALLFELDTIAASDRITLTSGVLGIGVNTLEFDDFAFTLLGGFGVGDYVLFDGVNPISTSFGPNVSGTLGGLAANLEFGDGGRDIVLHVAVPEPGSVALVLGGIALLASRRRRQS